MIISILRKSVFVNRNCSVFIEYFGFWVGVQKVYSRFSDLLQKNDLSSYRVSKDTGISQQTFSDWKIGKTQPKLDKLLKLAKYFNVPLEYFVDEDFDVDSIDAAKKVVPFSDDEEWNEYIDMYKSFSPSDRDLVLGFMKGLAAKNESDK